MKTVDKIWFGIFILILLTPLGLILPAYFKSGPAWGEWELKDFSSLWNAPVPDYAFKGWEGKGLLPLSLAYIASAGLGLLIVAVVSYLLGKLLSRKGA